MTLLIETKYKNVLKCPKKMSGYVSGQSLSESTGTVL